MLYFAYGSNMERRQMRTLCPGARFVAAGRLKGYQLIFDQTSSGWAGGVANVHPTAGQVVEGVLWEITEAERENLDRSESCPTAYIRKEVQVETFEGRTLQAFAYVGVRPQGRRAPSKRYMRGLVQGAEEHDLTDRYIAFLESVKTIG